MGRGFGAGWFLDGRALGEDEFGLVFALFGKARAPGTDRPFEAALDDLDQHRASPLYGGLYLP